MIFVMNYLTTCRLQECKLLLLTLILVSLLPATPELLIRTTIQVNNNFEGNEQQNKSFEGNDYY